MTDGNTVMTSLCPKLGKKYAEGIKGPCPSHMQQPFGKTLKISFIGTPPYVNYNPLGGSDFLVTEILANKFHFIPKFIPSKSVDAIQDNEESSSKVYQVKIL